MSPTSLFEALEPRQLLAAFTVTSAGDSGAGSLRQAILDANANAGADVVEFSAGLNGQTIRLTSGELSITGSLTVNGPGADLLTVSGNNASRVFNIGAGVTATINRLTITGGNAGAGAGGAIYSDGTLTVFGSSISGNTAHETGGITSGGTLTISHSTVSGNTAQTVSGGVTSGGLLVVTNSTISGNSTTQSGTGGIANFGAFAVRNSTIAGNTGASSPGGIAHFGSSAILESTIVAGNGGGDITGTLNSSSRNNLVKNAGSAGGLTHGVNGNLVGIDPLLGALANNGGATRTHRLVLGSPAIDAGLNPLGLGTDQRLGPFARVRGAGCDIGAFEVSSPAGAPGVTGVSADHGFGRFIESVELLNTFTAQVNDPSGNGIGRVEFVLDGITVTDANGADGWRATFDMGLLAGNSVLSVTAVDTLGESGAAHESTVAAAPRPEWLDSELLVVAFDVSGTQGYTATIGQGVGSVTAIPDFFPDSLLGTENFGAFFSGDLGVAAGFYFTVQIPFSGTPSVESLTVTWSAVSFDRKIAESDWTVPFENGKKDWSIFAPALDNIHELDIVNRGSGIGGTAIIFPGFFASGTVSFTMSEDLRVAFGITGTFEFVRSLWNRPPETLTEDTVFTLSEPLVANIPIPWLSWTLRQELTFDLSVFAQGSFGAQYSNGIFTGELRSLDASFIFEPALLTTVGQDEKWFDVTPRRLGLKFGGGCGFTLSLHDGDLKVGYQWDLVISIYIRPRGQSYGVAAPVLNFGSFRTENLLATNVSTLFTVVVNPPPQEHTPPPSIAETDVASYGDLAVVGYLTDPAPNAPSLLYARLRQGNSYGPAELIAGSDHERSGLTLSMAGGTPVAMWSQSTINRINAEGLPVEQAMAAREIYWSARINGAWTAPARLTVNGVLDWTPSVAFNSAGTAGIAAWVRNVDPNTFPAGTSSEILIARWNGSAWGAPVLFTSNGDRDASPAVAALADGRFMVSWARTAGGVDSAAYAVLAAGSTSIEYFGVNFHLPAGTTLGGLTSAALSDGRVALAWLENSAGTGARVRTLFFDPSNASQSAAETVANSRISSRGISLAEESGQLAIVFSANVPSGSTGSSSQVFTSYRAISEPSGKWTRAIPITRGDRDHSNPGAAYLGDHSLLVSYIASDLFGESLQIVPSPLGSDLNDPDGLQVARINHRPDLTITGIEVDQPGAPAGSTVTLSVTIVNAGPAPSGVFVVRVFADGVGEVTSSTIQLQPGQSTIHMPAILLNRNNWRLTVQLDPAQSIVELDEKNNSRSISSVLFADPTAKPGSTPVGAADASNIHRIVATNPYGQPLVFEQSGGTWTVTELTGAVNGAPTAIDNAVVWVDPKDNLTYAAVPTADGLALFTRSASGVWTFRNLTTETGAAKSPTHALTQFTSVGGIVIIAGITADHRIVGFQQTLLPAPGGGPAFAFVDISAQVEANGGASPVLTNLISYVPTWDAWHLAGIDAAGHIQSVWLHLPGGVITTWRIDDLSTLTGAPPVSGQLAVNLTSWGGINLTGLDSAGNLLTTWWVPGNPWLTNDLTAQFNGVPLAAGKVSGYTTPWGGLNYVGLAGDGTVMVYWWAPGKQTWDVVPLLPSSVPASERPTGTLTSSSSAAGTLNVYGTNSNGDVLRMWWQPGAGDFWASENLTLRAEPA